MSKKTRILIVASIFWAAFSLIVADTYRSSSMYGFFGRNIDFNNIEWEMFIIFISPVCIYWAYRWIMKGK